MDNQEAIEILREKIFPCVTGDWKEAVGVAISALQAQEEKTQLSREDTTSDLISRQAAIDALIRKMRPQDNGDGTMVVYIMSGRLVEETLNDLPSAQPEPCDDAVSRNAIIRKLNTMDRYVSEELTLCDTDKKFPKNEVFIVDDVYEEIVEQLPSAQPEWNNHTVACMLAELFDDTCACNYNGIDEWLPEKCELLDSCPNPVGVACWEQYLKHRAERRTDETD